MTPKKLVCVSVLGAAMLLIPHAFSVTATDTLWNKFQAIQQGSRMLHQDFEVIRRVRTGDVEEVSHLQAEIDFAQGKWRERPIGGEGERIRVFDGQDEYLFESGGTEYVRVKQGSKDAPLPEPYENKPDWTKAKELQSLPCGFSGKDHTCVILEAPLKPWIRPYIPGVVMRMNHGTIRMMIDTETGIWLRAQVEAYVEQDMRASQWVLTYNIKQMSFGATPDMAFFKVPEGLKQVDWLTRWDESSIKKELVGKPAPDLHLTDIHGNQISLAELKGKIVLLDFWTTWCPPCRADASSVEKLNKKYGGKNLAIIGISVDEDRATVEDYLKKHPHDYSVVLSSENQLPRPYQIGEFPTYMVIGADGIVKSAEAGDQGFGKLRKDLEKAGMTPD